RHRAGQPAPRREGLPGARARRRDRPRRPSAAARLGIRTGPAQRHPRHQDRDRPHPRPRPGRRRPPRPGRQDRNPLLLLPAGPGSATLTGKSPGGGARRVLFPLVARAGVLAEADAVLAAARAGRGALVTVTGEPGIGKTRLAEAVADRARARAGQGEAFEVIWTWCPAAAGGV